MEKYQAAFDKLNASHSALQRSCFSSVSNMSADEAYMYYSSGMQP